MAKRFLIGTFFGIGLYVHWSFLLLIGYVASLSLASGATSIGMGVQILLVVSLFACVAMHEYGHALAARAFGIPTTDITLLPIGGIARLARMPREPWQELIVAVAGPAVNVAIAALLLVGFVATGTAETLRNGMTGYWQTLLWANLLLVAFNSVPAFPMDGGRVLRALLAMVLEYRRATWAAARVGQGLAVVFGTVGVYYTQNPFLLLIALFVFWAAGTEARQVERSEATGGGLVRDAAIRQFRTIAAETPIVEVARFAANEFQRDWPVTGRDRLCGMLLGRDVARAMREGRFHATAAELMRIDIPIAMADDPLLPVLDHRRRRGETLPVVDFDGRLIGLLDLPTVLERLEMRRLLPARLDRRLWPLPLAHLTWPWSATGATTGGSESP